MMSRDTSSVGLILPLLNSLRGIFLRSISSDISSRLLIFATVTMANFPRWEFIRRGWASVSLMTPMPELPLNFPSSGSKRVRKYVLSKLWMLLKKPSSGL